MAEPSEWQQEIERLVTETKAEALGFGWTPEVFGAVLRERLNAAAAERAASPRPGSSKGQR